MLRSSGHGRATSNRVRFLLGNMADALLFVWESAVRHVKSRAGYHSRLKVGAVLDMSGCPVLRSLSRETLGHLHLPAMYDAASLLSAERDALIRSAHSKMMTSVLLFNSPKYVMCVAFVEPESAVTRYYLAWGDESLRLPPPSIDLLVRSYPGLKRVRIMAPQEEEIGSLSAAVCRQAYSHTHIPEPYSDVLLYVLWQAVLLGASAHTATDSITCFSDCTFQRVYIRRK